MKHALMLLAAFMLLSMAAPAVHAQTPDFCIFTPFGNGDQDLVYLQYGQFFGFTAWACPAPGTFAKFPASKKLRWQSTCLQGGITITGVSIRNNDTEIDLVSGIYDPYTGRTLGYYDTYWVVIDVGNQWLPTQGPLNQIGPVPCDPYGHVVGDQSLPQ